MATIVEPGKSLPINITIGKSSTVQITAAARLKLVTAETQSNGANLIATPTVQYWG